MNDITTRQNNLNLIELLKLKELHIANEKKLQIHDVGSVIIAILFPLLTLKYPNYQNAINAFGVLWTAFLFTYLTFQYKME